MGSIAYELLDLIGVGSFAPATMGELIPYLVVVFIGVMLVVSVFRTVSSIAKAVMNFRRA